MTSEGTKSVLRNIVLSRAGKKDFDWLITKILYFHRYIIKITNMIDFALNFRGTFYLGKLSFVL